MSAYKRITLNSFSDENPAKRAKQQAKTKLPRFSASLRYRLLSGYPPPPISRLGLFSLFM